MSDLISREAAIEKMKYRNPHVGEDGSKERLRYLQYIADVQAIREVPSAEPKKGKWIPVTNGRGGYECDQCHNYAPSYQDGVEWLSRYCPHCGAYMMKGEENG